MTSDSSCHFFQVAQAHRWGRHGRKECSLSSLPQMAEKGQLPSYQEKTCTAVQLQVKAWRCSRMLPPTNLFKNRHSAKASKGQSLQALKEQTNKTKSFPIFSKAKYYARQHILLTFIFLCLGVRCPKPHPTPNGSLPRLSAPHRCRCRRSSRHGIACHATGLLRGKAKV